MDNTKKYFFLWMCFFSTLYSFTQNNENFVHQISYYFDAHENQTSETVKNADFSVFTNPRLGYKNGTYWFKVLLNEQAKYKNIVFHIKEPSIESVVVFENNKEITTEKLTLGNTNISFVIENNKESFYFLKVKFSRQVHFPLVVKEASLLENTIKKPIFYRGIYYGLVLMVLIINMAFYISLKEVTFLYYALFLVALNISFMGYDGFSYLFFAQESIDFYFTIFHFIIQILAVAFATHFLNLGNKFHKKNKFGTVALCISLIFYSLFMVTNNFLFCAIGDLMGMLILVYFWFIGILQIKKNPFALFFVIGYSIFLFFGILFLIPLNFGLPFSVTLNQLNLGAVFEMLILSYAITYRVKIMQQENILYNKEIKNYVNTIAVLENKIQNNTNKQTENRNDKILAISKEHNLTERETQVLLFISLGHTNLQIAEELFISLNTIKYHTRNIYEKLDIKRRSEINKKLLF